MNAFRITFLLSNDFINRTAVLDPRPQCCKRQINHQKIISSQQQQQTRKRSPTRLQYNDHPLDEIFKKQVVHVDRQSENMRQGLFQVYQTEEQLDQCTIHGRVCLQYYMQHSKLAQMGCVPLMISHNYNKNWDECMFHRYYSFCHEFVLCVTVEISSLIECYVEYEQFNEFI